ncbi:hypothetical protein [Xanthobacter wiegelii]|uniref:hypothetical protein n=1 Tax=Xanthobacter wiegelii TaxID=3119913 RepID=UPI0037295DDA
MHTFEDPDLNVLFDKLRDLGGQYATAFLTNAAALAEDAAQSEWDALLDGTMMTIRGQIEEMMRGDERPGAQDAADMMIEAVKGGFVNALFATMPAEGHA